MFLITDCVRASVCRGLPPSSSSAPTLLAHTDALLTRLESVRISLETLEKTTVGRAVKTH